MAQLLIIYCLRYGLLIVRFAVSVVDVVSLRHGNVRMVHLRGDKLIANTFVFKDTGIGPSDLVCTPLLNTSHFTSAVKPGVESFCTDDKGRSK